MGVVQVEKIIERAVKSLSQHNQQVDRDRWLKEAKAAEEGGHFVTCEVRVPGRHRADVRIASLPLQTGVLSMAQQ